MQKRWCICLCLGTVHIVSIHVRILKTVKITDTKSTQANYLDNIIIFFCVVTLHSCFALDLVTDRAVFSISRFEKQQFKRCNCVIVVMNRWVVIVKFGFSERHCYSSVSKWTAHNSETFCGRAAGRGDVKHSAVHALLLCTSCFYVSWASKEAKIFVLLTISGCRNVG